MSKTYEALLKARREKVDVKSGAVPSEPVPEPEASVAREVAEQEPLPASTSPTGPEPKRATIGPTIRHERIVRRIAVGDFLGKPNSVLEEGFRKLKSAITTHHLATSLRSVLVTSCMPGEGKTMVALNTAAVIAKGLDESAILIDADLRRLGLTSRLGQEEAIGLSDVLEGRATIEEALIGTEFEGLNILPGGVNPGNPAELIASNRMRDLIEELLERYRDSYIVIDSTPLASTSEASVLSLMVDGIIAVIMADQTRRDVVSREMKTLNREKILGVVLNCADFETSSHYDYGRYYKRYTR
jgi:capsular exopolysaccharide synthesis family protein